MSLLNCNNMSDSEDGQLRSPNDEQYMSVDDGEHDTDSLYIKPPQPSASHSRDSTGSSRRKEKKHSKDRKHKEREHHRGSRGIVEDRLGEQRRSDIDRRDYRQRDERINDVDRFHHRSDSGREMLHPPPNSDRRYQKHSNHMYHYQQQQAHLHQQQSSVYTHHHHHASHLHIQQHQRSQRHDYYHLDYHNSRHHVQNPYEKQLPDYQGVVVAGASDVDLLRESRRTKYNYEQQKDPESLEQDLRSRLLSKRHKYVKDYETDDHYDIRSRDTDKKERSRGEDRDREHVNSKIERHKMRREKNAARNSGVIELLDSPEVETEESYHKRKNKHHSKEYYDIQEPLQKRKTPDDPELLARRAKFLAAEHEKEKRKGTARAELKARREMLKERNEQQSDALSPSAVAASVTAGLNIVKRKQKPDDAVKQKRSKNMNEYSDDGGNDDEEDENDESDTESEGDDDTEDSDESNSTIESEERYPTDNMHKSKSRENPHRERADDDDDDDDEIPLPNSPLSIGELYKSPKDKKKPSRHEDSSERRSSRSRSHSPLSETGSLSRLSARSSSPAGSSRHSRSHSRSDSERSNSLDRIHSRSPNFRSRSRSSSRSRSEERDMAQNNIKSIEDSAVAKLNKSESSELQAAVEQQEAPPLNEKGQPLPNYFPGIQGCRSVEEFQCLNRIEEGTYGVVYRAKDKRTNEIVALKRLKMEKEKEGFPITSLREINTLLKGQHPNIVTVREIVVGSNMDKIFIVMDYVEHDLKSLMETMKTRKQSFFPGEVKCLTKQLLLAVGHLHDNWILHRDLKTSNLLLSHKGILKVGDFGLAREYGSPLKKYTSLVVTLWYRAPELLLCSPEYSTPIDIWSVGCIFAEFLQMAPLFPGKSEIDQLNRIYKELGTPNEKIWPGYNELPAVKNLLSQNQFTDYPVSNLRKRFSDKTSELGISLLQGLLTYDPKQRLNADAALNHAYFKELPLPIDPSMFPTWPAKSELGARKAMASSPKPPSGGSQFKQLGRDEIVVGGSHTAASSTKMVSGIITGNKKSATNTGFVLNAGIDQRQLAMGPGFSLKF